MPAAARYSLATKQLVAELATRGFKVGCRAVEHWAELGLAPPPVRYSRGKYGFTSEYPSGAVDQYVAVASVMRRGQDWRVSGLLLIGRGHLPTREATFRFLLEYLYEDVDVTDDPLGQAEEAVQSADDPISKRLMKLLKNNISSAQLVDPVTGTAIAAGEVVHGVMAQIIAGMLGGDLPEGALEEIAAGIGLIVPGLSPEERLERTKFVEAMYSGPLTFEAMAEAARTVAPSRLQTSIVAIRKFILANPIKAFDPFPEALFDLWMISFGLADTIIGDLGGQAWFHSMGIFTANS